MSSVTVLPFSSPGKEVGTSTVSLIRHLWSQWDAIFSFKQSAEIVHLFESDLLTRSILFAVAASHLRHIAPGNRQHRIAEHYQQSLALTNYQKKLYTAREKLGQQGTNALFVSASLLNILSFALPEPDATTAPDENELDPESSWIFSPREDRMGWLSLQAGLRPLMLATSDYLQPSLCFLGQVFLGEPTTSWTFSRLVKTLEGVPPHWIEFFELYQPGSGCECSGADDVYRAPATIMATVERLQPTGYHVFRSLQFLGKLQGEFRDLIYCRDERALWLFGYWLGIMCRFEGLWWCERRVLRDYQAICLWLQKSRLSHRPGRQGELWATMMQELESVPSSRRSNTKSV